MTRSTGKPTSAHSPLPVEAPEEPAIAAGDYRLVAAPARGGAILALTWRGKPVLRETAGPSMLDVACFPLVPFSNRIAEGRFAWRGRDVAVPPNWPEIEPQRPMHGYGWLSAWDLVEVGQNALLLVHHYAGEVWPWPYRAELEYVLDEGGLTARLSLTNTGREAMPAGLGFHPYFPRTAATRYRGLHRGEWQCGSDPMPVRLDRRAAAIDWWDGRPVATRAVDTVYAGREGLLQIAWPDRAMAATIAPSPNLALTAVYVPGDADWFCIEPVSHCTDAVNGRDPDAPMPALEPGETTVAEMRLSVRPI